MTSIKQQVESGAISVLNASSLSQVIAADRGPVSFESLESVTELEVLVTAPLDRRHRINRQKIEWNFTLQIGIAKKYAFEGGEFSSVGLEAMDLLIEEIAELFENLGLPGVDVKNPICPEIHYSPDGGMMLDKGVFVRQVNIPLILWTTRGG